MRAWSDLGMIEALPEVALDELRIDLDLIACQRRIRSDADCLQLFGKLPPFASRREGVHQPFKLVLVFPTAVECHKPVVNGIGTE